MKRSMSVLGHVWLDALTRGVVRVKFWTAEKERGREGGRRLMEEEEEEGGR